MKIQGEKYQQKKNNFLSRKTRYQKPFKELKAIKHYIDTIYKLLNKINKSEEIPKDWISSVLTLLAENQSENESEDHGTIGLMSRVIKVFLYTIHEQIVEGHLTDAQSVFGNEIGTRKELLSMHDEHTRDVNIDNYFCFFGFSQSVR